MAGHDVTARRLFVEAPLFAGARIPLSPSSAHYLHTVLRLSDGADVLLFNGRDGEWRAQLSGGRKSAAAVARKQTRPQAKPGDLHYLFAPLKHVRLDYVVQKAVEMGVNRLQPVLTRHTQAERVNLARMRANAIEAAEQCDMLTVADIAPPSKLEPLLAQWPKERRLLFCDEGADLVDPISTLRSAFAKSEKPPPLALLIGPEGGFEEGERTMLLRHPAVLRLSLGPRILRADTAAVAALAIVQASVGDWV